MTAPEHTPHPSTAPRAPAGSEPSPVARRPYVTAILVARATPHTVVGALAALAAQTRGIDALVVLDFTHGTDLAAQVRATTGPGSDLPEALLVADTPSADLGPAINRLVAGLPPVATPAVEWLWLVADDVHPEPDALSRLVDAVRRSPSVGVAGPKVLDRARPRLLVEVGHQLTRSGRVIAAPASGEPDQGQYDTRTDVLAVGLPGLLIRRALFEQVGGFDRAFSGSGEALDLGWRAQLAGERVVVVPGARVLLGPAPTPAASRAGLPATEAAQQRPSSPSQPLSSSSVSSTSVSSTSESSSSESSTSVSVEPPLVARAAPADQSPSEALAARRATRRMARRVALARCSPWAVPFLALWVLFSSIGSALVLLLLKRPGHAWVELADLGALIHPFAAVGARWRFRKLRRLRRRDLATLFVTAGESLRHTADRVQEALTPERDDEARAALASGAPGESGPVAEEAEDLNVLSASIPERIVTNPGILATLAAVVVSALGFRSALRGGLVDATGNGLAGGELSRVSTDAAGLWHAYRDSWHGAGLGTGIDSEPYVGVLAALTWLVERLPLVGEGRSPASVMLAWSLVLGMPLATAAAYVAGRVVTRARWPRALVAVAWGTSGVAAASVSHGRVSLVLGHVLLPVVAAGVVRCARADGTFTAAAATALGAGLLGALVAPYVLLVALAATAIIVAGPGGGQRLRGIALLLLPPGVQGAGLLRLGDPVAWLGASGALDAAGSEPTVWWNVLAGYPDATAPWLVGLSAPVVLAGVLALVRRPASRGHAVAYAALVTLALVGLAWALVARRIGVGDALGSDASLAAATPWPGIGVQMYLLAMLALALLGSVGMRAILRGPRFGPRRVCAVTGLVFVAAAVMTAAGLTGWSRLDSVVRVDRDALPAVAVEQARGAEANRLLALTPTETAIEYQLIAREPGNILRGLLRPRDATDPGIADAVVGLTSGANGEGPSPAARLADLGVGFVSVQGSPDPDLLRTLDAAAGLTRLGSTETQTLWRVLARPSSSAPAELVPAARARITTAEGAPIGWVRVDGAHGALAATVAAGPAGRHLVLAEPPEWKDHAQVRYDGALLTATGAGLPTYVLPERAGTLTIDIPPRDPRWFGVQLALLAVTAFLAVPFGNRRSRRVR